MLTIDYKRATATRPSGAGLLPLLEGIEGRKTWKGSDLRFEPTAYNIALYKSLFPDADVTDNRNLAPSSNFAMDDAMAVEPEIKFRFVPWGFQERAFHRFKRMPVFALFSGTGTGKSKMSIDIISYRFLARILTGVIVITKKGPHREWIEDHLPEHLWEGIDINAAVWGDNARVKALLRSNEPKGRRLEILSVNHDAIRGKKFKEQIEDFLLKHEGTSLALIDESHKIKNSSSKTHEAACELGERVAQRGIATGTPLSGEDLTDEWSQFYFLDKNIIGIEYKTTFRAQFCVMHGQGKDAFVVGSKNVQQFNSIIAPYTFRASKEDDMDLPEKLPPHTIAFDLTDEQLRVQKSLKENFLAMIDDGTVTIKNAITLVTKLQTLSSGYLVNDDGLLVPFEENPRIAAYLDFLKDQPRTKRIIWARFIFDIETLKKELGDCAVTYYGGDDDRQRIQNLNRFLDPKSDIDYIIANGASMGTGTDGLQAVCHHMDFYSQQFNAIERVQCEDRIHRGGTKEICHYNDVAANSSVDKKVIASLRRKISFSDLTLDDLRRMINGI